MDILQEKWYGGLPCFKLDTDMDMAQPKPLGIAAVAGMYFIFISKYIHFKVYSSMFILYVDCSYMECISGLWSNSFLLQIGIHSFGIHSFLISTFHRNTYIFM